MNIQTVLKLDSYQAMLKQVRQKSSHFSELNRGSYMSAHALLDLLN